MMVDDGRRALLAGGDAAAGAGIDEDAGGPLGENAREFQRLRDEARAQLAAFRAAGTADAENKVRRLLEELDAARKQTQMTLRLEGAGLGPDGRKDWERRLQDWTNVAQSLRGELDAARDEKARVGLGLAPSGAGAAASQEQRLRASEATELLRQSSQRLEDARRQALETEAVGEGVLRDLSQQRETILNMRENVARIGEELTSARRSLDRMLQNAQKNRAVTTGVAAVLALGLAFWGLLTAGMPLGRSTLLMAVCIVALGGVYIALRRSRQAKAREIASSDATGAGGHFFAWSNATAAGAV